MGGTSTRGRRFPKSAHHHEESRDTISRMSQPGVGFKDEPRLHGRNSRWLRCVIPVGCAIVTSVVGRFAAARLGLGPIDDAYISLRYASHWATGSGLCFNLGERVEGYTNFLLVALEAAAIRLGVDPETAMSLLGWASLGAIAAVLFIFMDRHALPSRPLGAAVLAVAGSLNLALVSWAASGMETCLYAALLLASVLASISARRSERTYGAALLLVGAAMTRPEAVVMAPALAWFVYRSRRRGSDVVKFGLTFAGAYGIYFLARWLYFGFLFPNTFYAKLDYGSPALVRPGLAYVGEFVVAAPLLIFLSLASMVLLRRSPEWVRACAAIVTIMLVVVVYEGGDHFAMFRFLAPALPFLMLLAIYPLTRVAARLRGDTAKDLGLVAVWLIVVVVSGVWIGRPIHKDGLGMTQHRRFAFETALTDEWSQMGRWLQDAAEQGSSLSTIAIGAIGFHSGLTIVDPHGIVDPSIAHLDVDLGRGYAGHEKYDVNRVLDRRPSYFVLQNRLTGRPVPPAVLPRWMWGSFNKLMLRQPEFIRTYRYHAIEISPHQFMSLHVRDDLPVPRGRP